jgi:hypothetical protein
MENPLPSLGTVWSCGSGDPVFFPLSQNARLCGWAGGAVASSAPAVIPKCIVVASKRRPDKRGNKKKVRDSRGSTEPGGRGGRIVYDL